MKSQLFAAVHLRDGRVSIQRTITGSGGRLLLGEPKTAKSRRTITLTTGSLKALRATVSAS
jgi:hypothetical protein